MSDSADFTLTQRAILQVLRDSDMTDREISQRTGIPYHGIRASLVSLRSRRVVRPYRRKTSPSLIYTLCA